MNMLYIGFAISFCFGLLIAEGLFDLIRKRRGGEIPVMWLCSAKAVANASAHDIAIISANAETVYYPFCVFRQTNSFHYVPRIITYFDKNSITSIFRGYNSNIQIIWIFIYILLLLIQQIIILIIAKKN